MKKRKPIAEPQHVFPAWYCGEVRCERCHRALSEIDAHNLECVSDAHMADAQKLGDLWARMRRR